AVWTSFAPVTARRNNNLSRKSPEPFRVSEGVFSFPNTEPTEDTAQQVFTRYLPRNATQFIQGITKIKCEQVTGHHLRNSVSDFFQRFRSILQSAGVPGIGYDGISSLRRTGMEAV